MASFGMASPAFLAKFGAKPSQQIATLQNQSGGGGQGSGSGSMTVPQFELPEWLTTNPDNLMSEIMAEYSGTGKRFDTTGIAKAFNNQIGTVQGMGGQIADNAVREGLARSGQEGGSVNSAMLKAQAMLPVYDQVGGLKKDKALAIADVRAREAGMRADLARSIGGMRTQYLSFLADTYMRGRGMNASWQNQMFQQGMQNKQFEAQQDRYDDAFDAQGSAPPPQFQGQITRAPNNFGMGGVEYTPQFKEYLAAGGAPGINRSAPPPYYPGGGTSGPQLDQYNKSYRDIFSQINGRPSYNQLDMDSAYAQNMAGGYAAPDAAKLQQLMDSLGQKQKLTL